MKRKLTTQHPQCACCSKSVDAKRRRCNTLCQCHDEEQSVTTPSSTKDERRQRDHVKGILSSTDNLVQIGSILLHITLSRASHEDTTDCSVFGLSQQSTASARLSDIFHKTLELIRRLHDNYNFIIPLFSFGRDYPPCTFDKLKFGGSIEKYTDEFKSSILEHFTHLEAAAASVTVKRSGSQLSIASSVQATPEDVETVAALVGKDCEDSPAPEEEPDADAGNTNGAVDDMDHTFLECILGDVPVDDMDNTFEDSPETSNPVGFPEFTGSDDVVAVFGDTIRLNQGNSTNRTNNAVGAAAVNLTKFTTAATEYYFGRNWNSESTTEEFWALLSDEQDQSAANQTGLVLHAIEIEARRLLTPPADEKAAPEKAATPQMPVAVSHMGSLN